MNKDDKKLLANTVIFLLAVGGMYILFEWLGEMLGGFAYVLIPIFGIAFFIFYEKAVSDNGG